ncbi:receptor-like protein 12, partial [Tanacetum coccineum]
MSHKNYISTFYGCLGFNGVHKHIRSIILFGVDAILVYGQCHINHQTILIQLKNEPQFDSSLSTKLLEAECQRLMLMGRCHLQHQGSGHIPEELSQLTRLKVLDLSSLFSHGIRSLKLKNPCLANNCSQPHTAKSLSNCRLSGPLDDSLQKLQSLSVIRLALNDLRAPVPDFFANFQNLTILNLHACNLIGTFPKNVLQLQKLQSLDLSINTNLNGSLPEFPMNRALQSLVISKTN